MWKYKKLYFTCENIKYNFFSRGKLDVLCFHRWLPWAHFRFLNVYNFLINGQNYKVWLFIFLIGMQGKFMMIKLSRRWWPAYSGIWVHSSHHQTKKRKKSCQCWNPSDKTFYIDAFKAVYSKTLDVRSFLKGLVKVQFFKSWPLEIQLKILAACLKYSTFTSLNG